MYILSYDHGGSVLWGSKIEERLDKVKTWLDKYPGFRLGLDYEAFTFDESQRDYPQLNEKIKKMLADYKGRFALGSTTYGQPLSLFISDESNIRQLTFAIKSNLEHFGQTPPVYAVSEFALNNQLPQILKKCGYKAVLMRTHVMNYGYQKDFDLSYGYWKGTDSTPITAIPTYKDAGVGYTNCTLDNWILTRWPGESQYSLDDFEEKFGKYEPLLASRYDDICNGKEELIAEVEKRPDWQFILLEEIPEIFNSPKQLLPTDDNDFHGRMPWGYIGNYIFNGVRKAETCCESADAAASLAKALGAEISLEELENAWKYALISQHHDVTICGLLQEANRFIGSSLSLSADSVNASLDYISGKMAGKENCIIAFNPDSHYSCRWIDTGLCYESSLSFEGRNIPCEMRDGRLFAFIRLPAFTAKRLEIGKKSAPAQCKSQITFSENKLLKTPFYIVSLCQSGIEYIESTNGYLLVNNGQRGLFRGYIENIDCSSKGEWDVKIYAYTCKAIYKGKIGSIPFELTMLFDTFSPLIDCKCEFTMNGERVGRTGITKGIHTDFVVNGSVHEEKLRFCLDLCLDKNRKMYRDLPLTTALWDQQICEPESFWYEGFKVLVDHKAEPEKSFASPVYLQGINWAAIKDIHSYFAILNKGCIGNVITSNSFALPLIYANEYMCGTRMLTGKYTNEFSITFDENFNQNEIHSKAKAYNHPFLIKKSEGTDKEEGMDFISLCNMDNENIFVLDISPVQNGLEIHLCNYSDYNQACKVKVLNCNCLKETNLLGEVIGPPTEEFMFKPREMKAISAVFAKK